MLSNNNSKRNKNIITVKRPTYNKVHAVAMKEGKIETMAGMFFFLCLASLSWPGQLSVYVYGYCVGRKQKEIINPLTDE